MQITIDQPGQASDFYSRRFGGNGTVEDTFNPVFFLQGDVNITITETALGCAIADLTSAHVAFVKVG